MPPWLNRAIRGTANWTIINPIKATASGLHDSYRRLHNKRYRSNALEGGKSMSSMVRSFFGITNKNRIRKYNKQVHKLNKKITSSRTGWLIPLLQLHEPVSMYRKLFKEDTAYYIHNLSKKFKISYYSDLYNISTLNAKTLLNKIETKINNKAISQMEISKLISDKNACINRISKLRAKVEDLEGSLNQSSRSKYDELKSYQDQILKLNQDIARANSDISRNPETRGEKLAVISELNKQIALYNNKSELIKTSLKDSSDYVILSRITSIKMEIVQLNKEISLYDSRIDDLSLSKNELIELEIKKLHLSQERSMINMLEYQSSMLKYISRITNLSAAMIGDSSRNYKHLGDMIDKLGNNVSELLEFNDDVVDKINFTESSLRSINKALGVVVNRGEDGAYESKLILNKLDSMMEMQSLTGKQLLITKNYALRALTILSYFANKENMGISDASNSKLTNLKSRYFANGTLVGPRSLSKSNSQFRELDKKFNLGSIKKSFSKLDPGVSPNNPTGIQRFMQWLKSSVFGKIGEGIYHFMDFIDGSIFKVAVGLITITVFAKLFGSSIVDLAKLGLNKSIDGLRNQFYMLLGNRKTIGADGLPRRTTKEEQRDSGKDLWDRFIDRIKSVIESTIENTIYYALGDKTKDGASLSRKEVIESGKNRFGTLKTELIDPIIEVIGKGAEGLKKFLSNVFDEAISPLMISLGKIDILSDAISGYYEQKLLASNASGDSWGSNISNKALTSLGRYDVRAKHANYGGNKSLESHIQNRVIKQDSDYDDYIRNADTSGPSVIQYTDKSNHPFIKKKLVSGWFSNKRITDESVPDYIYSVFDHYFYSELFISKLNNILSSDFDGRFKYLLISKLFIDYFEVIKKDDRLSSSAFDQYKINKSKYSIDNIYNNYYIPLVNFIMTYPDLYYEINGNKVIGKTKGRVKSSGMINWGLIGLGVGAVIGGIAGFFTGGAGWAAAAACISGIASGAAIGGKLGVSYGLAKNLIEIPEGLKKYYSSDPEGFRKSMSYLNSIFGDSASADLSGVDFTGDSSNISGLVESHMKKVKSNKSTPSIPDKSVPVIVNPSPKMNSGAVESTVTTGPVINNQSVNNISDQSTSNPELDKLLGDLDGKSTENNNLLKYVTAIVTNGFNDINNRFNLEMNRSKEPFS